MIRLESFTAMTLVWLIPTTLAAQGTVTMLEPGAKVEKLAGGMKFTEGPVWLPAEKKLVFSDIPNSTLMQWSAEDGLSKFRPSESANGNILDRQGRIVSCQHGARNVIRIEKDGSTKVLADRCDGKRFNSPNDVIERSDGTLWFTDPPWGLTGEREIEGNWVFRLDPATGQVEPIIKDLAMPNGIVFSPDEQRLYVADTGGHPMHPDPKFHDHPSAVHCYEVSAEGKLGKHLFQTDAGSDGMAVDTEGNIYTTHGDHVTVYDANGKKLQDIPVPEGPANCCFGGDDYRTLFITARTSLYSVRTKHAGVESGR